MHQIIFIQKIYTALFFLLNILNTYFLASVFTHGTVEPEVLHFRGGRREKRQNARTQILQAKPHCAFSDLSQTFKDISRWKNIQFCGRVAGRNKNKAASLQNWFRIWLVSPYPWRKKKRKRKKQLCIEMSCKSFKAVICKILVFADGSCSGGVFALRFPEIITQ